MTASDAPKAPTTDPAQADAQAVPEVAPAAAEETPAAALPAEVTAEASPEAAAVPAEETPAAALPAEVIEASAASEAAASTPAPSTPAAPKPGVPKPGGFRAPSPVVVAKQTTHHVVTVPVAADVPAERMEEALAHGLVEDGIAYVIIDDERVSVGPAADEQALHGYAVAYFELEASIERFGARLSGAELGPKDIDEALVSLDAAIATPAVVGDFEPIKVRLEQVRVQALATRERILEERRAAREAAAAAREVIVSAAEAIVAKPAAQVHWKNDTAELRGLLDQWKEAQRSGARLSKDVEREMWSRFTHARSAFEKSRKHHFAELDKTNTDVAGRKESLVARAEELAQTTDWDRGARGFRDLMDQWRTAGRGRRNVDDALWKRFQAAQDAFFESRRGAADAEDTALASNVEAKEAAVVEAEALLPVKDLAAAKRALRPIQDRFEAAGQVPRAEATRLAKRMTAVEKAVRDGEEAEWNRRNPELEARASGAAAQLSAAIAGLEADIAAAKAAGKSTAKLEESLKARKSWLKQVEGVL